MNLADVKFKATVTTDSNGDFHLATRVSGLPIDRDDVMGYCFGPRQGKLAARLARAIEAGAVFTPVGTLTDINSRTFLECEVHVCGRTANADLKRLGF